MKTPANQINKVRNTEITRRENVRLNSCGCIDRIKDLPNEGENAFQTSRYSDKTAAPIMPIRHNKETTSSIRMDESDKK